uniref:Uncharacterized protein n=1 Tax=Branchiostoma floridae TaxID=7739 RepID=C3ZHM4_BRAFL|eukprot:XP_002592008.1 hypothetical protein BRAFLDRAFT_79597 [Branchiostoma floridae]
MSVRSDTSRTTSDGSSITMDDVSSYCSSTERVDRFVCLYKTTVCDIYKVSGYCTRSVVTISEMTSLPSAAGDVYVAPEYIFCRSSDYGAVNGTVVQHVWPDGHKIHKASFSRLKALSVVFNEDSSNIEKMRVSK